MPVCQSLDLLFNRFNNKIRVEGTILKQYTGFWGQDELLHLLGRCLFGVGHKEYTFFKHKTLDECLDTLLKPSSKKEMLLQEDPNFDDPLVPNGKPWINAPYENDAVDQRRKVYLKGWWVGQMINRDYSLTEKMTLFLHNHFVTELDVVRDARYSYLYVQLLREYALGNYRKFIREGTSSPAMLVYLNGNTNTKDAPNENYGRELLELFTLGKGNFPNYTENDVREAARVLTGWKEDKEAINSYFSESDHDSADKHFSSFFGSKTIKGRKGPDGKLETDELVEMLFKQRETALFICRNLYRWFVCAEITPTIEEQVILPLADTFQRENFELRPVLKSLLGSEHFYKKEFRGSIVKSPVDFLIGATHQFELKFPSVSIDNHLCWLYYGFVLDGLSQMIGDPASVSGWPAYYQGPKYHQWWINSYTLGTRKSILSKLASWEKLDCNGPAVGFDFISFVKQMPNPQSAEKLTDDCLAFLVRVDVLPASKKILYETLTFGLIPDTYWAKLWAAYEKQPTDPRVVFILKERLQLFFDKIFSLPEYQMS